MTLPVRVGARVTRFALNTTLTVSARALALAGGALQSVAGRDDDQRGASPSPSGAPTQTPPKRAPSTAGTPARAAVAEPSLAIPEPPQAIPEPPQAIPEPPQAIPEPPAHVSEEPELVAEVSEPGVEDGVGATVTVDEPWDGYTRLNAKDIVDHLVTADPAELAAIQLYESTHKQRETVLTAVARELRREAPAHAPTDPSDKGAT